MPRAKTKVTELLSKDEALTEMKNYAEANSKLKELDAKVEQEIQSIRDVYASDRLTLITEKNQSFDKLQYYAEMNREELFSKKKSLDMIQGIIGFRTGTPKVKAVKTTLAKALELVKEMGLKRYLRTKVELNKDEIIDSREDAEAMGKLNTIGLHVVQEETFFIEPNEEGGDL